MTFGELRYLVGADLYRERRQTGFAAFARRFFGSPVFRYLVWWRLRGYVKGRLMQVFTYHLTNFLLARATYRLGIRLPQEARIGPGVFIPHFGQIWVSPSAVIGANCNLSQGVTIGGLSRGERRGAPVIGDNVYIGPNATLAGGVTIGNNAMIAANSLVITDVPDEGVMIGVPAKLFSRGGSYEYVNNTDYDKSR